MQVQNIKHKYKNGSDFCWGSDVMNPIQKWNSKIDRKELAWWLWWAWGQSTTLLRFLGESDTVTSRLSNALTASRLNSDFAGELSRAWTPFAPGVPSTLWCTALRVAFFLLTICSIAVASGIWASGSVQASTSTNRLSSSAFLITH